MSESLAANDLQVLCALAFLTFTVVACWGRLRVFRPRPQDIVLIYSCLYFSGSTLVAAAQGQLPSATVLSVASVWASFFLYGAALLYVPTVVRSRVAMPTQASLFLSAGKVPIDLAWMCFGMLAGARFALSTEGMLFNDGIDMTNKPFWVQVVAGLATVLSLGLMARAFASWNRIFTPVMGLSELAVAMMQGRRPTLEVVAFVVFCYLATDPKRLNWQLAVKLALLGLVFAKLFSPLFLAVRSEYGRDNRGRGTFEALATVLPNAVVRIGEFQEASDSNIGRRAAVHAFNYKVAEAQADPLTDPMLGEAFGLNVLWNIPTALFRNKTQMLLPETAIQAHHGLPLADEGANWPNTGYADFWIPGGFIAGAIMSLLLDATLWLSAWLLRHGAALPSAVFAGITLHAAIYVDTDPMEFLQSLRDGLILSAPFVMFARMPR
jgi:hypothetical protein